VKYFSAKKLVLFFGKTGDEFFLEQIIVRSKMILG
jgi:hypothetical protein